MSKQFFVTGLGLQIDKVMIMPGSALKLNDNPPGHWSSFGTTDLDEADAALEKQMIINPAPSADAPDLPDVADMNKDSILEELRALEADFDARDKVDLLRVVLTQAREA